MDVIIQKVDYQDGHHADHLIGLLAAYALDPMGGGEPLPEQVKQNLVSELARLPYAVSFLAYHGDRPVGLLNAFEGFSTFKAKPLLNIHDLAVLQESRGMGVGEALLNHAENYARERGFCKLTLEVLAGNQIAKNLYKKSGFLGYQLHDSAGSAEFWQKSLA